MAFHFILLLAYPASAPTQRPGHYESVFAKRDSGFLSLCRQASQVVGWWLAQDCISPTTCALGPLCQKKKSQHGESSVRQRVSRVIFVQVEKSKARKLAASKGNLCCCPLSTDLEEQHAAIFSWLDEQDEKGNTSTLWRMHEEVSVHSIEWC